MTKKVFLILIFSLCLFFYGITNTYYCDGLIDRENCESWSIIENIDLINYFESDYTDIKTWYFWSKFLSTYSNELETNLWYLWNKYNYNPWDEMWGSLGFLWNKRNVLSPNYQIPVWLFSSYKNQELNFIELEEENTYLWFPLVKFIQENSVSNNLVWNKIESCISPKSITNAKIEIKNSWLLDYIHLSWDNPWKEKVKIIRNYPENKEFLVTYWVNYLDDYDVREWQNYSYFIAVYNDCNKSWLYSDILKINYSWEKIQTKIYLSLSKDILTLNLPNTIEIGNLTEINLKCNDNFNDILNEKMVNYKFQFDKKFLEKTFFCEASFFDNNWKFQKSELYVNNVEKGIYIKEKEALDYIYKWISSNLLFDWLYLNISKFDSWAYLTYWKSSLYLVNTLAKVYLSNENLSLDALKNLWYLWINISAQDKITEENFINLLLFIEKDINKFQKGTYEYINKNYSNKKYNITLDEIKSNLYYIEKLKEYENVNNKKFNDLLNCISKITCNDIDLIKVIDKWDIKQEIDVNSYKDYMKILYFSYGEDSFKKYNYSLEDYNKFVDILVESVSYGDTFYDNKISFDSFWNLQFEILLHKNLQKNISYLVEKHLEKILQIYNTSQKEDMISVLREFLSR